MLFDTKSYLKSNRYHTVKHALKLIDFLMSNIKFKFGNTLQVCKSIQKENHDSSIYPGFPAIDL